MITVNKLEGRFDFENSDKMGYEYNHGYRDALVDVIKEIDKIQKPIRERSEMTNEYIVLEQLKAEITG